MTLTRTRLSQVGLLGAAAFASIAFAAGPASAAATLSVSPGTGLSDGQSVSVNGNGFTAGDVGVAQCIDGLVCSTAIVATADAQGSFATSLPVKKTFTATDWATGKSIPVDCSVQQCRVVAWQETTGQIGSNISFN